MSFQRAAPRLILASTSSTRAALMRAAGLAFETTAPLVDEAEIKASAQSAHASADDTAVLLAEMKARRVAGRAPEALVVGADQLLVCEGRWFDKPRDVMEARANLQYLRGRVHTLVTAVVVQRGTTRLWHYVAQPLMTMRSFSDIFLDAYLAAEGNSVMQSVGGYRVEGAGLHLFDRINGEHSAILGLPMLPLLGFLRQNGVVMT